MSSPQPTLSIEDRSVAYPPPSQAMSFSRRKRRYEEFFASQKSYKVHKAILSPHWEFFRAATKFGKEKEERKLDLHEDEPAVVKLLLQFLYEMDYHVPKKEPGSEPATLCLEIVWGNDQLERRVRRNLEEGLAKLDEKAMGRAADIVQGHRPNLLPDENNSVVIDSSDLDISIIFELTTLLNDPESSKGPPVYRPDLDLELMIHAKVYCVAEKYNIKALKDLAVEKLSYELPHVMVLFTNNEIFDVIDYVFSNTPDTKGCEMRRLLASAVHGCLKIFGMKSRIEEKMKQFPDLALLTVQETFRD